jgi:medium-chain acyl-[acyl-carrier-protein] hydrolase
MTSMIDPKSWVIIPKPLPSARLRVFCLPYAGGSSTVFRSWPELLQPDIEVAFIQLPGRGARFRETPFTHLVTAAQTLAPILEGFLDKPYMFFGHSLGALLSFELIRELRRLGQPDPAHLFVCARSAPQLPDERTPIHKLPDPLLVTEVQRRYGGIPQAILDDPEMLQLFLPILRADLQMLETYEYTPDLPFNCAVTACGGYQDLLISEAHLAAWEGLTLGGFSQHMFPGNHFFVQNTPAFMTFLADSLKKIAMGDLSNAAADSGE